MVPILIEKRKVNQGVILYKLGMMEIFKFLQKEFATILSGREKFYHEI
jgi:hypothetical protein